MKATITPSEFKAALANVTDKTELKEFQKILSDHVAYVNEIRHRANYGKIMSLKDGDEISAAWSDGKIYHGKVTSKWRITGTFVTAYFKDDGKYWKIRHSDIVAINGKAL